MKEFSRKICTVKELMNWWNANSTLQKLWLKFRSLKINEDSIALPNTSMPVLWEKKVCKANSVEESVYIFQRFESKCDIPYYNKNYSEMAVGSSCLCRSQPNLYFSTDKLTQNLFITHTHKSTYRVKTVTKYSLETPSFQ